MKIDCKSLFIQDHVKCIFIPSKEHHFISSKASIITAAEEVLNTCIFPHNSAANWRQGHCALVSQCVLVHACDWACDCISLPSPPRR